MGRGVTLLRAYPTAWRTRYGDELAALLEELDESGRMTWHARLDVVRAGVFERVRLGGLPPRERAREGTLLVVYAWMLFVLAGFGLQKASEHWAAATPANHRGLPTAAFDTLVGAAGIGSALVLLGVALSLPTLLAFVRRGGRREVHKPIVRAVAISVLLVGATAALAAWAHELTPAARNGHDHLYSGAFVAWILFFAACLFAWAAAAATTARRLAFSDRLLRLESILAAAVCASMAVMTAATAVWWGVLASTVPSFVSPAAPNIVVPTSLMLAATLLGLLGVTCTRRAAFPSP
ncbi:MAG TPA: hypothetical protein VGL76_06415 [Gaiellaceae bacterium]